MHEHCLIGSKPGVSGAFCFTHHVRVERDVANHWATLKGVRP
jgi:hypothetical protein